MSNRKQALKRILLAAGILPVILILLALIILLLPAMQKYLLENQLDPWLSDVRVNKIHISPFGIEIKQLKFTYDDIDIDIEQLDAEISPFSLLSQRIKIDKFIVSQAHISDQRQPEVNSAAPAQALFYGLFPYFDSGFIYDIGVLDIQADYHSAQTGLVKLSLSGVALNELTENPLLLKISALELPNVPDIQGILLDATISLSQHEKTPIDAQHSLVNLTLISHDAGRQYLAVDLAMKQLAKPEKWATFPFDRFQTHYLKQRLHPEQIELHITQTDAQNKQLSDITFDGQYDGNEGIISGALSITTDKTFTRLFQSLALPDIETSLHASIKYNTRRLEGHFNLADEFKIENYASRENSSLPETVAVSNHLFARIDDNKLTIHSFLLNILSEGQAYINILTHKPILVNLEQPEDFLQQQNSKLMTLSISQLPLTWFNDFLPSLYFEAGFLDTDINLALENQSLILSSKRPLSVKELSLWQKLPATQTEAATKTATGTVNDGEKPADIHLLSNENLQTDFIIKINTDKLDAAINKLQLYTRNDRDKKTPQNTEQLSATATLQINNPEKFLQDSAQFPPAPLHFSASGHIDLQALAQIPALSNIIAQTPATAELSHSLPDAVNLNYALTVSGESALWSVDKADITLSAGKNKATSRTFLRLNNTQKIQLKQQPEQLSLVTKGSLLALDISRFDFAWIEPLINHYATPYSLSGQLSKLDLQLSADSNSNSSDLKNINYLIDIPQLSLKHLQLHEAEQLLFKNLSIYSKMHAEYSPEKLLLHYPSLKITKNKTQLLSNSGKVTLLKAGNPEQQRLTVKGKLNADLQQLMNLKLVEHYSKNKTGLKQPSLLDAQYSLTIHNDNLTLNASEIEVSHPKSQGKLQLTTHQKIKFSLKDGQHNFSQNGHLSIKLINFDVSPYDAFLADSPVSFDTANGQFDLLQSNKKQQIIFKQPLTINNIHYKNSEKRLLNPFDLTLDMSAQQHNNLTQGKIKQLSIMFRDKKQDQAFELSSDFTLDHNQDILVSEVDGQFSLSLSQWLRQPLAMPDNTLSQGTLTTRFTLDKSRQIKHQWLINHLIDDQGEQLVESIAIDGSGQLNSLSSVDLTLPIIMKSISGESNLSIATQINLEEQHKKLAMKINGREIFLNDLLKLLAAINPQSELSKLKSEPQKETTAAQSDKKPTQDKSLNKVPAREPFWKSGLDINAELNIDKLYYSDYMSYQEIVGELVVDDRKLHARDLTIKFHDSPMTMDALFEFQENTARPYNIKFNTTLSDFKVGEFLKELNPEHVPRAEGVFDVNVDIYGGLSNLTQIRNELMFDIEIEGRHGIYHLIPANDIMMRSSGNAMAVVGEVVSVLPTSGFGLGIVNRVIRFAKDIDYDFIRLHLHRNDDLNTNIETFQIISPELHLFARGGLTFVEDTRLFDQPLAMQADLDLAGEGAAIFYGLGLLKDEQDEYGFWKGPVITFSGTLNHQKDNFNDIINQAKSGTMVGGITNPFSGIIGNFKYRWFGDKPNYNELEKGVEKPQAQTIPQAEEPEPEVSPSRSSFFEETF